MKRRIWRGLAVGGGSFLLAFFLHMFGIFQSLEWKSWDWRLKHFADPDKASKDIILCLIDQKSLDVYEKEQGLTWPWPREMYSYLVEYCRIGGAKAVFFDLIFSESSTWGVGDDKAFSEAMTRAGNVFLPVFLSHKEKDQGQEISEVLKKFTVNTQGFPSKAVPLEKSATLPIEDFLMATAGIGNA